MTCCASSPLGWQLLDALFLAVALLAVWMASKNTSNPWIKKAMLITWLLLAALMANNYTQIVNISELWLYLPATILFALHIYNQRQCRCNARCSS